MAVNKKDVIKLLERIAVYLELKGENPFKIAAYRRAAQALERDVRSLSEIEDFTELKGIGKGTSEVIKEYVQNGKSELLQQLEEEIPPGLATLLNVPGLGGKKLAKLYQELNVTDAESLKAACEDGKVEQLAGFGKKTAEKLLEALKELGKRPERVAIAVVLPLAEKLENALSQMEEVEHFSRAGSLRRMEEFVKDLDFIISTSNPERVKEQLLALPNIKEVIAKGDTKVSVTMEDVYDINIDFRIVEKDAFATALHHFTGSKEHNVRMRQLAKKRQEKISEYGVEVEATGEVLTFSSEKEFFQHFGLYFIPPEVREDKGEIEAFTEDISLIDIHDIKGDLHMHTTWSDGAQSLEEMVEQCRKKGYQYMAITDHSKFLRVADGLDEKRLRKQREEIEKLNEKYEDIHIFAGVEMDILPDGRLDFSDDFLQELDFVIASIHSGFQQSEEEIMKRLYNAMENPYVTIIAHPTGRILGRRKGYSVDLEKVINKAKETNTVLELNANPNRLDLSAPWVKLAQDNGVPIVINTDAHSFNMLHHMEYGVRTARKGWIEKETVINTWDLEKLHHFLQFHKKQ